MERIDFLRGQEDYKYWWGAVDRRRSRGSWNLGVNGRPREGRVFPLAGGFSPPEGRSEILGEEPKVRELCPSSMLVVEKGVSGPADDRRSSV